MKRNSIHYLIRSYSVLTLGCGREMIVLESFSLIFMPRLKRMMLKKVVFNFLQFLSLRSGRFFCALLRGGLSAFDDENEKGNGKDDEWQVGRGG